MAIADDESTPEFFQYWGKAQPDGSGALFHPLPYHCLDVAAVAVELLERLPLLPDRLSALLKIQQCDLPSLIAPVVALHDVGKFSVQFQGKRPDLTPANLRSYLPVAGVPRHDLAGLILWTERVAGAFGVEPDEGEIPRLIRASVGHHGEPVELRSRAADQSRSLGPAARAAALEFAREVLRLLAPSGIARPAKETGKIASWVVAGLTTLADWIGSNQAWFPYSAATLSLSEYWDKIARPSARRAVTEAGLLPAAAAATLDVAALLGAPCVRLRPMQHWAWSVAIPHAPALFLIEDVTGSGKTEASLILAHRLMAAGRATGLFVALPTQATANAMFERLAQAQRGLFASAAMPSIALAHGKRDLEPGFRAARLAGGRRELPYGYDKEVVIEPGDVSASAQCAAWIADDRRLAFFADIGAGTVDQALLGVLPSRHQALRLLGLMQRVLIVDEVHAYDPYVRRELTTLLRFHAAFGGDAILLSATLPAAMRSELIAAFREGACVADRRLAVTPATDPTLSYPLATVWSPEGESQNSVAADPTSHRRVSVRRLSRLDEALAAVRTAAEAGLSVIYIRNTVGQAIEAHAELFDLRPLLFHARFALVDRLAREREVVTLFGKHSGDAQRSVTTSDGRRVGRILIATQVAEQSLDLDFDLGVSDLAPVDLLIQRAGRVWRHERRSRRGSPTFLVLSPDPDSAVDDKWVSAVLGPAAAVYPDSGVLWLSARAIFSRGLIETPGGLRALIEEVYGPNAHDRLPTALRASHLESIGQGFANQGIAASTVLTLSAGYACGSGKWDDDTRAATRLGEKRTTLRLAVQIGDRVLPWASRNSDSDSREPWVAWRLSEIDVYATRVACEAGDQGVPAAALSAARDSWTRWDQEKVLIVLREEKAFDRWIGSCVNSRGQTTMLGYHPETGLTFDTPVF